MPNGRRLLVENACYHLIVRGNRKQKIFLADCDYEAYLEMLAKYKKHYHFLLYGYCLMPLTRISSENQSNLRTSLPLCMR
jgi:REP element-mobilizing transposase RayT